MANIFQAPQHKAQIGYNGFDMSQYRKFTSSVGQLLPVYYDLLNPGDKVSGKTFIFSRTQTLEKAAMCSLEEHFDWFFVPMEQLYHPFNEFYNGVQDFGSSMYDPTKMANLYPYFNLADINVLSEQDWSENTFKYFNQVESDFAGALRLLDLLGFPVSRMIKLLFKGDTLETFSFIPVLLQAYQKIYMDYFRLCDREANDASCYNLDKFYNSPRIDNATLKKLLQIRYAPYKKDFFTNTQISPIFSADNPSSVSSFDYLAVNQWLTNTYGLSIVDGQGQTQGQGSGLDTTVGMDNTNFVPTSPNNAPFNVANIRSMFALDKLLEITRRAGKHYDKQTLAHFGVSVPEGISGECTHIAHFDSQFEIQEVTANSAGTAGDSTTVLGQIGGKGYNRLDNTNDNYMDFTANCHGVLMCIYHAKPIVDYYQVGTDKINTLVKSVDWFKPEFDDLGMQPLFGYQEYTKISQGNEDDASPNAQVHGWQYRYNELKCKYNVVNGGLAMIDDEQSWTTAKIPSNHSVLKNFLINPAYLDNIMLVNFKSRFVGGDSPTDIFGTDPLLHMAYFDIKKASKMSTYGLPNL